MTFSEISASTFSTFSKTPLDVEEINQKWGVVEMDPKSVVVQRKTAKNTGGENWRVVGNVFQKLRISRKWKCHFRKMPIPASIRKYMG